MSMKNDFNPAIKAVVSLRKIATEILDSNEVIRQTYKENMQHFEEAMKLIAPERIVMDEWIAVKTNLDLSIDKLIRILNKLVESFKTKQVNHLSETWEDYRKYSALLQHDLTHLKELGDVAVKDMSVAQQWGNHWEAIQENYSKIKSIAETYKLKLTAIEELAPAEIDEITKDILNHIPAKYTEEEAFQYEKEYMQAYNELKEIAKKKNLWDKILNVLAGGVQETPAQRVYMKRWLEGEAD